METTRINMDEQSNGNHETERIFSHVDSVDYSDSVDDSQDDRPVEEKRRNGKGKVIGVAAAGIGVAALAGGVAMAANPSDADSEESEEVEETTPSVESDPKSKPEHKPEPEPTPDNPTPEPGPDPVVPGPDPVTPGPDPVTPGPEPAPSPHIEEVLVDPDDIDGEHIMNIVGTGTTEIAGVEFNTATVTDQAGNTYYLVDVDGEVNDPNATYDIIVDAENGEMMGLPFNLSQSDAQLMADNGVYYTPPTDVDSNNLAQADMKQDVFDPSGEEFVIEEPPYTPETDIDGMAENMMDSSIDIIDPLV